VIDAGRTNYIATNFTDFFPLSELSNKSVVEIETELIRFFLKAQNTFFFSCIHCSIIRRSS
jgi:hypothetical protein